jgi:uncharacterized phage protein gp47/JayE
VAGETLDLSFSMYFQRNWSWEDVEPYAKEAIESYFLELAQGWADQDEALTVRISQLESRLLSVPGVLDIASTKINGEAANFQLPLDSIPILGTMTATTATIAGA